MADTTLKENTIYEGTVSRARVKPYVMSVVPSAGGPELTNCINALSFFSAMSGLKARFLPAVGTRVLFLYSGTRSVVLCTLPGPATAGEAQNGWSIMGDGVSVSHAARATAMDGDATQAPQTNETLGVEDLIEGELDLTNMYSVGIQLLTTLASMKAGDHAKIEVHALNDMVRMVSDVFRHFSAFGDHEIFRDGNRLGMEFRGSTYNRELHGGEQTGKLEDSLNSGEQYVDKKEMKADDAGRHRLTMLVGHIGDMMNLFIHEPGVVLGQTATEAVSGKFRAHIGSDGTLLVQSVADIIFEKVVRIPVPRRKHRHDDPAGTKPDDMEKLPKDPLKGWDYKGKSMFHIAYQLRENARWVSQVHALARIRQGGDWEMSSETDTPAPDPFNKEDDRKASGAGEVYVDSYSTIRMMRDGSILSWDGYGNAVAMVGGDITVSSVRNLALQAAGHLTLEAGQNLVLKAGRSIEATAAGGEMLLTSKAVMRLVCTEGTLWLVSGADPANKPDNQPVNTEDPSSVKRQVADECGVIISSPKAGARFDLGFKYVTTMKDPGSYVPKFKGYYASLKNGARTDIQGDGYYRSSGDFTMGSASRDMLLLGSNLYGAFGTFAPTPTLVMRYGTLSVARVLTNALQIGKKGVAAMVDLGENADEYKGLGDAPSDEGKVTFPNNTEGEHATPIKNAAGTAAGYSGMKPGNTTISGAIGYLQGGKAEYPNDKDGLFRSHAQMRIAEKSGDAKWDPQYEVALAQLSLSGMGLTVAQGASAAYPGVDAKEMAGSGGAPLDKPAGLPPTDTNFANSLELASRVFRRRKYSTCSTPAPTPDVSR